MTASTDTQSDDQQQSWTEEHWALIVRFEKKIQDSLDGASLAKGLMKWLFTIKAYY